MASNIPVERQLPQDNEAEQWVLGSLMLNLAILPYCNLEAKEFNDSAHQVIFKALQRLYQRGIREVDKVAFRLEFFKSKEVTLAGGDEYISKLFKMIPHCHHMAHYAEIVRRNYQRRRMIVQLGEALGAMYEGSITPADQVDRLMAQFQHYREEEFSEVKPMEDVVAGFVQEQEQAVTEQRPPSLLSGILCCDEAGLAFVPGELSIIAALPSVGKSAFVMQCAMYQAQRGRTSLFVSIEMPNSQVGSRIACPIAGIDSTELRSRLPTDDEIGRLKSSVKAVKGVPVFVWSPSSANIMQIEAVATMTNDRNKLGIIFIDYLQLIEASGATRNEQVGFICKSLKRLAKQLKIPVVVLAQFNRGAEEGKRPEKRHLRDSGEIEQDADTIYFLWNIREEDDKNVVGFCTAKNRQGRKGDMVAIHFERRTGRFIDPKNAGSGKLEF